MGCCTSNILEQSTYQGTHGHLGSDTSNLSTAGRPPLKRTFNSCKSSASSSTAVSSYSSGVYSRCTTPNSTPVAVKPARRIKSFGYHSETAGTSTSTGSDCTSLSNQQIRYTRDTSEGLAHDGIQKNFAQISNSSNDMELYMMTQSKYVMAHTSSPLVRHRNTTYTLEEDSANLSTPTRRYLQWQNSLQRRHVAHVKDVSNLPEALAGHFSPNYFPAYTDVRKCENPPKRFKPNKNDVLLEKSLKNTRYVISTDL